MCECEQHGEYCTWKVDQKMLLIAFLIVSVCECVCFDCVFGFRCVSGAVFKVPELNPVCLCGCRAMFVRAAGKQPDAENRNNK